DVLRRSAAFARGSLDLQRAARAAVAAELEDVTIRAIEKELLDEAAAGERVPVLRPAGDEQDGLVEDGLVPRLRQRLVAGDLQHPAVARPRAVQFLSIKGLERDVGDGDGLLDEASHEGQRSRKQSSDAAAAWQ